MANKFESKKILILCNLFSVFTFTFFGEIWCACKYISSYDGNKREGKVKAKLPLYCMERLLSASGG